MYWKPTLVAAALTAAALAAPAYADVLRVPKDFATIQQAVTAAEEDDVIVVTRGTYDEQVVVSGKTGITIRGKGRVTIDGGGGAPALRVQDSTRVTLQKLTLTNGADQTLHVLRSTDCVVTKCRVQGAPARGLVVAAGGGHTITKNRFADNVGSNIDLDSDASVNPTDCVVTKNKVSGGFAGIELQGTGHLVQKNKVTGTTGFAVQTFQSDDLQIEKNKLTKLQGVGVRIRGTNTRVVRNKIVKSAGDAIYVSASATGALLERNTIKKPGEDGIDTDDPVDGLTVRSNNVIAPADDGLDLSLTNGVVQKNKVVKAADHGVRVGPATADSEFSGNKTKKSGDVGLRDFAGEQAGNTFTDNRFDSVRRD